MEYSNPLTETALAAAVEWSWKTLPPLWISGANSAYSGVALAAVMEGVSPLRLDRIELDRTRPSWACWYNGAAAERAETETCAEDTSGDGDEDVDDDDVMGSEKLPKRPDGPVELWPMPTMPARLLSGVRGGGC